MREKRPAHRPAVSAAHGPLEGPNTVLRYRTEIVIAADRYVCLQLPKDFPEGRAVVLVSYVDSNPAGEPPARVEPESDREEILWWEEFDGTEPIG